MQRMRRMRTLWQNKAAEAEMIEDSLDSYQQEISEEETQEQELVKGTCQTAWRRL